MTLHLKTAVSISFYCVPMKSDLNQRMGAAGFLFSFRLRRWTAPQANSYANEVISRISRINLLLLATSVWSVTLAVTLQFISHTDDRLVRITSCEILNELDDLLNKTLCNKPREKINFSEFVLCIQTCESKSQMLTYFEFTLNSKQEDGLACS